MPEPKTEWTLAMLDALPDDGNRYELLDGELLVSPVPSWRHQRVLLNVYNAIDPYVEAIGGYETLVARAAVTFTPRRQFEPDLFVVPLLPDGRTPTRFEDVGRLLLAVEVASPGTIRNDRYRKRPVYQEQGVPEYWLVDPDARLVERWRPGDTEPEVLHTTIEWRPLPGRDSLIVELEELFSD